MYTEEGLLKLKYVEIIEIAKSFNVHKSKSKKVDLIQRILKAVDEAGVDDRLPTGPVECDDSRRGTFVIESPADSKPVEKRAKKVAMPVVHESEEEVFDNNVPDERPEPRRTRRATFTTAKNIIDSQRVLRSRKTEQSDETVSDRRETFVVKQKPTRKGRGKKKISILPEENELEEEPTEEKSLTEKKSGSEHIEPSLKREGTFEITEIAVVDGEEKTDEKNEKEVISDAIAGTKSPIPVQRQRTFDFSDLQNTTEIIPTRYSLRKESTFEITEDKKSTSRQTSPARYSLRREGTFEITEDKKSTSRQTSPARYSLRREGTFEITEDKKSTSRQTSSDENKLVNVSDLKTYVPEIKAQPVHKMSIFERLHANVSLVERRSVARNSTQPSEKKASRKFSATSATPLKKMNQKLSSNLTPNKERKQNLLALKEFKNQRFTPRRNGLTPKPSSALKAFPCKTSESKCRTPFAPKSSSAIKGKTPEAKSKIPFIARKPLNFAAIHKANFDNMESIADHKERVAKRAETLFSPVKNSQTSQKLFNVTIDAPRVSQIPVARPVARRERSFASKAPPTNVGKIREKQKDFLKGVRVNRRFLLQMERKNQ